MSILLSITGHSDVNLGDLNGPAVVLNGDLTINGTSTITIVPVLSTLGSFHVTGVGMVSIRPNDPYFI